MKFLMIKNASGFACFDKENYVGHDPGGGGGDSHMEQTGMLVGTFEFNP